LTWPQKKIIADRNIAVYSAEAAKRGLKEWFTLLSLLSLNLAVVNILPFPALDGGRLMFVLYETITKRKMNQAIERNLNLAGISLLIFLAILISIHDVVKLIR
jgi:regulator of sigma E protease